MAGQQQKLLEEVTCPICMDILQEPVTIDCGHNFCLQCISQVGRTSENIQCPLCKFSVSRHTFRANKLLASLAEKIQAMAPGETQREGDDTRCQKHKEKLHYFCEQDGLFLCVVCRDSKDHRSHSVTLIDEAAQNYQVQIESQSQDLKQKDKKIIEEKKQGEGEIRVLRAQVHLEKLKILEEFKRLHQSLDEEERFLLSRLDWLEQQGARQLGQYISVTEQQLSNLRKLTNSLKCRLQAPSIELLKDIKDILSRSKEFKFLNPTPVPAGLEKKSSDAKARHESITETLKKFKDNLKAEGKSDKSTFLDSLNKEEMESWRLLQKSNSVLPSSVPVTLDVTSADPGLTFSQDLKKVTLYTVGGGASSRQSKPRPFYPFHCVRGCPGLSSGRQVWEAQIHGPSGGACMVGVATELAQRSQSQNRSAGSCIWALRISASGCQPFTNCNALENIPVHLKRVGVHVDHDCGEVVFYDVLTGKHVYTFQTSFDQQVFPLLGLQVACSHITLSP
ncbi:E3 ubiquitin-protein ligase TRIM31 [Meriones unguiculatus]|uniref:E3 ubiquitin-protein ligase TRIM31 n=1 Tax=Meriones unguiculatus TaxID=10047 RepID=UPI000B4F29BC|nr:E3 ubiquitin-protein ligase TRIM31-like [Meriones unguiculatus]XP_021518163.1 E3 ubiquitin-protein ligase TRIM31 [Meriones unguiculatus]